MRCELGAHPQQNFAENFSENKCFGALLAQEIDSIAKVMDTGEKPVTAVFGGAKVSSKITVIENLLDKIDFLIIGGGMVYTFIKALGGEIGESICEDDFCEYSKKLFQVSLCEDF